MPIPDPTASQRQLHSLALLEPGRDERFERVARLAQRLVGVPAASVELLGDDRRWVASPGGHDVGRLEQLAEATICGPGGSEVGTLRVHGTERRTLSADELASLTDLAAMVERDLAGLRAAAIDPLTGLCNRRGFTMLAGRVLETCTRRGLPASLVFCDLDGFKEVNDRLGHAEGDRLLCRFARLVEATLRTSDVVARIGGDEFVALLTGTTTPLAPVGRLRRAVASANERAARGGRPGLSVSIGLSVFDPTGGDTLDDLVARADAAMYADKRRGA